MHMIDALRELSVADPEEWTWLGSHPRLTLSLVCTLFS